MNCKPRQKYRAAFVSRSGTAHFGIPSITSGTTDTKRGATAQDRYVERNGFIRLKTLEKNSLHPFWFTQDVSQLFQKTISGLVHAWVIYKLKRSGQQGALAAY